MSGRPNLVVVWSNSGNFPSGPDPWDGQPLAIIPAATFFTPNTKPAAEDFNYLFGNLVADIANVYKQSGSNAGQNWHDNKIPIQTSAFTNFAAFAGRGAYDKPNGRWVFALRDTISTGGTLVYTTRNQSQLQEALGNVFGNGASGFQIATDVLVSDTVAGLYLCSQLGGSGNGIIFRFSPLTTPNWVNSAGVADTLDIELNQFNGEHLAFFAQGVSATASGIKSTDGITWTAFTIPGLTTVPHWRTAKSPTSILAFSKDEVSQTTYIRSTNGTTWTAKNIPIATGASVSSVCYGIGPFGPAYVVVAKNSGGIGTDTWISYDDGLTFTEINSITSYTASEVEALGSLIVAIDNTVSGANSRPVFSLDGGLTWRWVSAFNFTGSGNINRIAAGDIGFLIQSSSFQTFSMEQGLADFTLT